MVARARRSRGRGRGASKPITQSEEPSADRSPSSLILNPLQEKEPSPEQNKSQVVADEEESLESSFAPMISEVVGASKSSPIPRVKTEVEEEGENSQDQASFKTTPNGSSSSGNRPHTDPTSNDFEFTVDDTEMAEFDVDDVSGEVRRKRTNPRLTNHRDDSNISRISMDSVPTSPRAVSNESTTPTPASQEASAVKGPPKKSKRKFGLEYILVSLSDGASGAAPSSMKESPHECVLCLPGHSFNATLLAKHIHSAQHLRKVLELHSSSLYEEHSNTESAEKLHAVLCDAVPVPLQPVKLLVVPSAKLEETRARVLKTISARKESLATGAARSSGTSADSKRQQKRQLSPATEETPAKRSRLDSQNPQKPVLMLGDDRAKQLYDASPELQQICSLSWFPSAQLTKLLSGSIIALNSSHQVLVIVGLQNDFVVEKKEGTRMLLMLNPDLDAIERSIITFALKVKALNPTLKIFFTLPPYIDFIEYTKKVKHLSPADFSRLEDFSCQIINAYKRLHSTLRHASRNLFCYNMSVTLRSVEKIFHKRPQCAQAQMQFPPNTLTDGFGLTEAAAEKVASDLVMRAKKVLAANEMIPSHSSGPVMIQSWADCDNIIVIGDHHTFKFDASGPCEEMTKNVTLVSERFQPISTLLERADKMLNPSVDLLVIVGFYREFAQNVINGKYTILEPQVPVKNEIFDMLLMYKKRWTRKFKRLTIVFTIPHVVDFFRYNTATNPGIQKTEQFNNQMNIYTHQFSINIMSFYKDLRPALTLGTTRVWLYHITNSLFDGHEKLLQSLGNFNAKPLFPPHGTLDGFKPSKTTAFRLRSDLIVYISKVLRKHPVPVGTQDKN